MAMSPKKMCVIGAGLCGLGAVKACLEEGHEVDCFDKLDNIGGLWRYRETNVHGVPSVTKNTIIDTSKEFSAYSDFPPEENCANFMHNTSIIHYLESYAKRFHLLPHVHLEHHILEVKPNDDYDATGKWKIKIKNQEGDVRETVYDGVFACTGHHTYPHVPTFPGLDQFEGRVIHTHDYKTHEGFEDKTVVIVGVGNSGMDTAIELARICKQVYLSTRRGVWVFSRVHKNGLPWDAVMAKRWVNYFYNRLAPSNWRNYLVEKQANDRMDHELYGLKPKHRFFEQHPTVGDDLPNAVLSGRIIVKGDVHHFTKNGVVFRGEDKEVEIDGVVLATGYTMQMSYIDRDILEVKNNVVDLYQMVFPPHLKHPTLAVIGFIQPHGAICPMAELQSRWAVRVITGKTPLPDKETMLNEIRERRENTNRSFVQTQRHTVECNYIDYMDEIGSNIGVKPNLPLLAVTDPKLFWACAFGPCVPYQYRIHGPHAWAGARKAIFTVGDRIKAPLLTNTMANADDKPCAGIQTWVAILVLLLAVYVFFF